MRRGISTDANELKGRYVEALERHLGGRLRTSLQAAGKLGREAVSVGINTSALAKIHKHAVMALVSVGEPARTGNSKMVRAATFLAAVLRPMDETHRDTIKKNGHLVRLQQTMRRSTAELAGTQRQLKRELARRKLLETALRKSKQQHVQLQKRSRRAQDDLRRLSHEILSAQEDERKRISRELHDEIGQALTAVNIKLATLKAETSLNAKALKKTIRSTQRLVEQSMDKIQRFARDLRPPLLDDLGLIPALHAHLKAFTELTGVPVRFTVFASVENLDSERQTVLFRVAQQAFANIAAHAQASLVVMKIQKGKDLVHVEIRDNGKGFDLQRRLGARKITRLGLIGMRERLEMVGGSFEIESAPDEGTTIRAQLPFAGPANSRGLRCHAPHK